MTKPFLLLDIDGVCLNWETGLENYLFQQNNKIEIKNPNSYSLEERFGLTTEEVIALVDNFHKDPGFGKLSPMDGAIEAMEYFKEKYQCVAITAVGEADHVVAYREKNLYNCFGGDAFSAIHCVKNSASKRKYLNYYPPSNWVEDHASNAVMGTEYGHTAWLINAPYNINKKLDYSIKRINKISDLCLLI